MRPLFLLTSMLLATAAAAQNKASTPAWETAVSSTLGRTGAEMPGGVYRIGLPRTDLHVTLDGVSLKPGFAFGGWLAFEKHGSGDQVMVMGDLVLTDAEVNPVMSRLLSGGLEVTALHNHLLRATPHTMYLHVGGHGEAATVAQTLRTALAATAIPMASPGPTSATPAPLLFDVPTVERALGRKGKNNNGVLGFSIPRAQRPVANGMPVPDAMGSAIAINFQPTSRGRAAITGDFVLAADEVRPVMQSLRSSGIEVTALHNHMLDDEPRLFFMHFWADGDPAKLAVGLADALRHVRTVPTITGGPAKL